MVMLCDIIFDIATSIVILLETILIELFSVMCVLAIDVWKTEEITDVDPHSTPTRDNNRVGDEFFRDDSTTSSTENISSQHSNDIGSKSDELSAEYRHLQQEQVGVIHKRKSRAQDAELVGSQIVLEQ